MSSIEHNTNKKSYSKNTERPQVDLSASYDGNEKSYNKKKSYETNVATGLGASGPQNMRGEFMQNPKVNNFFAANPSKAESKKPIAATDLGIDVSSYYSKYDNPQKENMLVREIDLMPRSSNRPSLVQDKSSKVD